MLRHLEQSERSHKRGDFANSAIFRCPQEDEIKHVIVSDSETIQPIVNQNQLQGKIDSSRESSCPPLAGGPKSMISRRGKINCHVEENGNLSLNNFVEDIPLTCTPKVRFSSLRTASSPARGEEFLAANSNNSRKVAFTLAEVLITLAIIGVVAALTIPSLIEKYKQQVIISKLNKVYSVISQAYISAKNDNGEIKNWNLKNYEQSQNNDEDILYYLLPYLKVQKFCGKKEKGCFPDVKYGSIGSTGFGINIDSSDWYSKAVLDDGTVIASITFSDIDGVIRIDVNGSNPPNVLGIDLFTFYFDTSKIVPFGVYGVGAALPSNSFYINRGDYCTAWVIYGKTMDYIKDKKCEPYK